LAGVKVTMGATNIDLTTARVEIRDLKVGNPEGYHSPYLLHADRMVVDIELQKLVFSLGKDIDIEEMVFDGVDVIYEKTLTTSNVNDILTKLSGDQSKAEQKGTVAQTSSTGSGQQSQQASDSTDGEAIVHKVLVQNVGAKMATSMTKGAGVRLEVGDISYEDFSKEMSAHRGFADIVRVIISTILKSVLATVIGKKGIKQLTGAGCCSKGAVSQPGKNKEVDSTSSSKAPQRALTAAAGGA